MSALLLFVMNILPLFLSSVLMLPGPNGNPFPAGNTLLVTAHPDDEVMFFSTAVQALTAQPKGDFWALCLSNGASPGALLLLPTASDPTQCARALLG